MKCTAVLNIFLLLFSLLSNAVEEEIKNNSDEQAVQPVAEPVSEEIKAEEVKNNLDEQAVQPVAEPVSEEIKAEEPAAVKELTETEKDMQAIEPGFVPKDDRVTEIFLLNKQINQNELEIKNKEDEKIKIRNSFINYFQEKLREYSSKFLSNKEEKYYSSLKEKVEFLEKALDYNNKNSKFRANDYYDYANDSFKLSEYEFSKNFALYSQAKEQGKEDVPYPDEDFSRSIKAYKYIIKNYPKFKHIEDVYYMYSISLWFEGDFYKAVKYFKYIIFE